MTLPVRRFAAARLAPVLAALVAAAALLAGTPPAPAQEVVESIVAEVNADVISSSDLEGRLRLAILAAGLPIDQQTRERLTPQVLRGLIDERLRLQEAERLGIAVDEAEIDEAFAGIARQNGLTAEQFDQVLRRSNVPPATLRDQIRARLAWRDVVRQRLVPTVEIPDEAIDEELRRIEANQGKPEYRVGEIFLGVDSPQDEAEVAQFARELVSEIRAGAEFEAVARQFSQGAGAAQGGDLGWVLQGQLPEALDTTLQDMSVGRVSDPIRTLSGFHILQLRDRRLANTVTALDARVELAQLVVPLRAGAGAAGIRAASDALRQATAGVESCQELEAVTESLPARYVAAQPQPLRAFPEGVQDVVLDLDQNTPSEPQADGNQVVVIMVCSRESAEAATDPEMIRNRLAEERVELLQRRYLRDLRDAAFIEMRS
ncbi:MAG: peptidylprolyl isomerase [Azospirillaceae bacterium]